MEARHWHFLLDFNIIVVLFWTSTGSPVIMRYSTVVVKTAKSFLWIFNIRSLRCFDDGTFCLKS